MSQTSVYAVWGAMRRRCYKPNAFEYRNYGGRGITVCDRWRESFEAFYEDMGDRPFEGAQIDRIDNDGPYSPENCRWATCEQQQNNKREPLYEYKGREYTMKELVALSGVSRDNFYSRKRRGWSIERCVETPARHYSSRS